MASPPPHHPDVTVTVYDTLADTDSDNDNDKDTDSDTDFSKSPMEKSNLSSLPPSMLHMILQKVCQNSVRDYGAARIMFRGFNKVGRKAYFYRSADLLALNEWIPESEGVRKFKCLCYRADNPTAFYMRGMYEFFMLHSLDSGRKKIRDAGGRGCEVAKYVDGMLDLVLSADERGWVHLYPNFTRDYVDRMASLPTLSGGFYGYQKPVFFMELLDKLDRNCEYDCRSSKFVDTVNGSKTVWTCDKCFWQFEAWRFCELVHSTVRQFPTFDDL